MTLVFDWATGEYYDDGTGDSGNTFASGGAVFAPADPRDAPNPNNPGGLSDNEILRRRRELADPTYKMPEHRAGQPTGRTLRDSSGNVITVRQDEFPGESAGIDARMGTVSRDIDGNLIMTPDPVPTRTDGPRTILSPENRTENTDRFADDVRSLLAEERARKGPSEAEALLNKSADRIQAQALGLAASARGGAGAVARAQQMAQSLNQASGAQATQDVAILRGKEEQDRRNRLVSIMQMSGANAGLQDQIEAQYTGYQTSLDQAWVQANSNELIAGNRDAVTRYLGELDYKIRTRTLDIADRTFLEKLEHDPLGTMINIGSGLAMEFRDK